MTPTLLLPSCRQERGLSAPTCCACPPVLLLPVPLAGTASLLIHLVRVWVRASHPAQHPRQASRQVDTHTGRGHRRGERLFVSWRLVVAGGPLAAYGRARAGVHHPWSVGLGSSKAPAAASTGHQGAPYPPPPPHWGLVARAWELRALLAGAVPLWWALQVGTRPPAHTHPAARHLFSRNCRQVEKPERVLAQQRSQAGRASPLMAAQSGQEGSWSSWALQTTRAGGGG